MVPDTGLSYQLGLVGNRALFVGNGFPFSEKYFIEYGERYAAVYGSFEEISAQPKGGAIGLKKDNIYHSRTMTHFLCLSRQYKIDYVVRKGFMPFDERYSSAIVFRGSGYVVYSLDEWGEEYSCRP